MLLAFRINRLTCIVAILWFAILSSSESFAQNSTADATFNRSFVVGKVSDNPKKHYRFLKPMADYLAHEMQDLGFTDGKVLMAKNNQQMIKYLKQGKVDLVTETAFSAMLFHNKANAELLVRKWKKGVPDYYTVFFVRRDSGIETLQDLKGKTIALEDPGSTTAFYVPVSVLLNAGLQLQKLSSPQEKPPADKVGYLFSHQEINTSIWVHKGLVNAGAFNNLDWGKDDHMPQKFHRDLRVIYRTGSFPRAIELVRKDLSPRIKSRLKTIFLSMHKTAKGKSIMRAYQQTKKFDEITKTIWQDLNEVSKILGIVEAELNK